MFMMCPYSRAIDIDEAARVQRTETRNKRRVR